jgi:hypothetical protein
MPLGGPDGEHGSSAAHGGEASSLRGRKGVGWTRAGGGHPKEGPGVEDLVGPTRPAEGQSSAAKDATASAASGANLGLPHAGPCNQPSLPLQAWRGVRQPVSKIPPLPKPRPALGCGMRSSAKRSIFLAGHRLRRRHARSGLLRTYLRSSSKALLERRSVWAAEAEQPSGLAANKMRVQSIPWSALAGRLLWTGIPQNWAASLDDWMVGCGRRDDLERHPQ